MIGFQSDDEIAGKLARFLSNMARGEPHDHVSPLVGNSAVDPDGKRAELAGVLAQYCQADQWPGWLQTVEQGAREGLGTLSKRLPWEVSRPDGGLSLRDKFLKYYTPRLALKVHGKAAAHATIEVAKLYPVSGVRLSPVSLEDAAHMFERKKNYGYPNPTSEDEENLFPYYAESARLMEKGFPLSDACDYPCVATTRSQAVGPYQWAKDRPLSMYSRVLGNHEKRFQCEAFLALRDLPQFAAWRGQDAVDELISALLRQGNRQILSVDFSSFDASVPFEILSRIVAVVQSWFDRAHHKCLAFLGQAFMRSGMYLPDGYRHTDERSGGVPSGSVWTNWFDSLCNLWVFHYAAFRCGGRVEFSTVNGDDGVYTFKGISDLSALSRVISDELHMTVSIAPGKSMCAWNQVCFLQMHYHSSYTVDGLHRGVRPVNRVLVGMCGHERRLPKAAGWLGSMNTYRWLQQVEPCKFHPSAEGLWRFLAEHDSLLLEGLYAIQRGDSCVELACNILSPSDDGGKIGLRGLRSTQVVQFLMNLLDVNVSSE